MSYSLKIANPCGPSIIRDPLIRELVNTDPQAKGVGMGDNKNFMSIMTVIIVIIMVLLLNSITATKIVKIRWNHCTNVHVSEQ